MPSTLDLPWAWPIRVPAADALFDTFFPELHRLARRKLARQGPARPMGVTTLFRGLPHDLGQGRGSLSDRARFLNYAARVMRGLIIDEVRRRR